MILEKICPQCGKMFLAGYLKQVCCSRSCGTAWSQNKHIDKDFDWKKEKNGKFTCRFNPEGCACLSRHCEKCGHNPDVAKARLRKMGVLA